MCSAAVETGVARFIDLLYSNMTQYRLAISRLTCQQWPAPPCPHHAPILHLWEAINALQQQQDLLSWCRTATKHGYYLSTIDWNIGTLRHSDGTTRQWKVTITFLLITPSWLGYSCSLQPHLHYWKTEIQNMLPKTQEPASENIQWMIIDMHDWLTCNATHDVPVRLPCIDIIGFYELTSNGDDGSKTVHGHPHCSFSPLTTRSAWCMLLPVSHVHLHLYNTWLLTV